MLGEMNYVPLPIAKIEVGTPLPVDVWDTKGVLLLCKGQTIGSEQGRKLLAAHRACATEADYKAWMRSYDRLIYTMLREGVSNEQIAKAGLPATILDIDYAVTHDMVGGWIEMQDVLHGLLYQGTAAKNLVERLEGVQKRALQLIKGDPDDSLFSLFQALADPLLGYCATHGLLAALLGELTAQKLGMPDFVRPVLFQAALSMNLGMAKEQDTLTRQNGVPDARQQQIISDHARLSADILRGFGVVNEDLLDIVELHHDIDENRGMERNLACRRILRAADILVAKMASRANRVGLSARSATRAIMIGAVGEDARVRAAMAEVIGFYPPGTFVALANGEKAISVKRGTAASTPLVVSIMSPQGLALGSYVVRDTREEQFAVRSPVSHAMIKLTIHPDRIAKAVQRPQSAD
jgi:hypothetical protein